MTPASTFRRSLLLGCALGASLGLAEAGRAQAVNAAPNTVSGVVQYSRFTSPTPGSETVTIFSDTAIINWTPPVGLPPGPYVFLPAGNLLRFENGPQNFNFVVLNRILTNNPSRFDGTVISRLQADSVNPERPGGTVLFSSPGGIIVGPTALFDVGNLVLTTLNVVTDANNNFVTPAGGFQFNGGDAFPNAAVITEPGAQFVATAGNSYIAMIAPRVIHGGDLRVNGSAAYIGAEAVEISVNQGLFDIVFTTGSANANPVVHTGSSGGPASSGDPGDNQAIHFAAVPKSQAITMLLQGNAGFDPAVSATVENGVVVLSAGYNVDDGFIAAPGPGAFPSNIALADGSFTSDTVGAATGNISATATAADPLTFAGDLRLDAIGRIDFLAGPAATVQVGEDLDMTAAAIDLVSATAGGDVTLDAGGAIAVGFAQAGDDFRATAGTTFAGGNVVATGLAPDSESDGPGTGDGSNIVVNANGSLRLDNGQAPDSIRLASSGASIFSDGTLRSTRLVALTPLNLDLNDVFVIEDLNLATAGGFIDGNSFNSDGDIVLDAALDIDVGFARAGDDFSATAGGALSVGIGEATGLGVDDEAGLGPLGGSNIVVVAVGNLRFNAGDATHAIRLDSTGGSIFSAATLLGGTDVDLDAASDIAIGFARAGDDFTATAGGGFTGDTAITTGLGTDNEGTGSNVAVQVAGELRLNFANSAGDVQLASTGGNVLSDGTLIAQRDLIVNAANDVVIHITRAGDDFTASAGGTFSAGTVEVTGLGTDNEAGGSPAAGHNIIIAANGNLRLGVGEAPDSIRLTSFNGSLLSDGRLRATRLIASAPLNLDLNDVFVTEDLVLATADGFIAGNSFNSDGAIILNASQAINLAGPLNAGGAFQATAGTNGTFGDVSAPSVAIIVGGNAGFNGAVLSPTILVTSADIDIGAAGALGDANTQLVTLNVRPTATQTVLGGAAEGPGYTLTDAEADRIRAARLIVQAPANGTAPGRPPDLVIRDLSLSAARTGQVDIVTPGIAEVQGELLLANAGAASALGLRATERLQVVTPLGGIRVRDAAGLPGGTLTLTSNNIWAASRDLIDRLIADPNFAGRDAALTLNDGAVNPRGSIEAADVELLVRDSLFVQNSGSFAAFAGITVRESTLTIVPTGQQPLSVFAFGARINPDASFVTNSAFFREVAFRRDGAGFTDQAQFNLCFINTGICRLPDPDSPVPGGRDTTEEPVGDRFPTAAGARDDLVDTSFSADPLIEEPVTSGSDPVLWDCDRDDDGDCDGDDRDE